MRLFRKPGAADGELPPDKLELRHLAIGKAALQAMSGLPTTADGCAYDPIQRLLAVCGESFVVGLLAVRADRGGRCSARNARRRRRSRRRTTHAALAAR
jgi:hypothetical protein